MIKKITKLALVAVAATAIGCQNTTPTSNKETKDTTTVDEVSVEKETPKAEKKQLKSLTANYNTAEGRKSVTITFVRENEKTVSLKYSIADKTDIFNFANAKYGVNGENYKSKYTGDKLESVFWISENSEDGTDFGCIFGYDNNGQISNYYSGVEENTTFNWENGRITSYKTEIEEDSPVNYKIEYSDTDNTLPFDPAVIIMDGNTGFELWYAGITGKISNKLPKSCEINGKSYSYDWTFNSDQMPVKMKVKDIEYTFEW